MATISIGVKYVFHPRDVNVKVLKDLLDERVGNSLVNGKVTLDNDIISVTAIGERAVEHLNAELLLISSYIQENFCKVDSVARQHTYIISEKNSEDKVSYIRLDDYTVSDKANGNTELDTSHKELVSKDKSLETVTTKFKQEDIKMFEEIKELYSVL